MTTEIELRLIDTSAPNGEVAATDIAALVTALQELMTRITREVVNAAEPCRSKQFIEELGQLRLRAIEAGSAVLRFSKGPTDPRAAELPEQLAADDRFWEVIRAIGRDRRPGWVSDRIAASAGKLVRACQAAAPTVIVAASSRGEVQISSTVAHAETWTSRRVTSDSAMRFAGYLEKVDLRSHEFRLRDAVDNTVVLKHVENDTTAAPRVGQWVVAEGAGVLHSSGRLVALEDARVLDVEDPAARDIGRRVVSTEELLASAPGPDPDGGLDLTDEEFEEFLKAARS